MATSVFDLDARADAPARLLSARAAEAAVPESCAPGTAGPVPGPDDGGRAGAAWVLASILARAGLVAGRGEVGAIAGPVGAAAGCACAGEMPAGRCAVAARAASTAGVATMALAAWRGDVAGGGAVAVAVTP